MKILSLLFILLLSSQLFAEDKTIVLKRLELTMPELLQEAEKQTGLKLDLQVRESKAVKMFYDCSISLSNLLVAVKGYYKNQADLDLMVIKTENGYWLGLEALKYVEPPKVEPKIPETKPQKVEPKKEKKAPKLKKTIDQTKKSVLKSKKKISNFFSRVKNQLKHSGRNKNKTKKGEAEGNDIRDVLKLNSNMDMNPTEKNVDEGKKEVIKENFQMHPAKKAPYRESDVIDIELKNNQDHKKAKLNTAPAKIENLDMDL